MPLRFSAAGDRRAVLAELKEAYWRVGVQNLRRAEEEASRGTLFATVEAS